MKNLMTANRQWASRPADQRFQSIDDLAVAVSNRRNRSRAADIPLKSIEALSVMDGVLATIVLNHGIKQVEPSHWAFGQLCASIGAPASYMRSLPISLAVENINHGLHVHGADQGERKFMTILDDGGGLNTLQACTSTTYGRIWDADVVSAVQRLNERSGNKFYNPKAYDIATGKPVHSGLYASDRDVFIFMIDGGSLLDVGPRAQLNRGFIVGNSEVGSKTFWLTTFLFNVVCGNHIIWGAREIKELSIRHTSGGPARFDREALPTLLRYVDSSAVLEIATVKRAQDYLLPAGDLLPDWIQRNGKFSKGEIREAVEAARLEEGDCSTLWQLVQGFTASARSIEFMDARVDLEMRAGALLQLV